MKLFLFTLFIVGLCVIGLCFNIIFKKDGKFPDTEIEHNKEMRKRGLQCAKVEERKLWNKKNKQNKINKKLSLVGADGSDNKPIDVYSNHGFKDDFSVIFTKITNKAS